jgi:hypothetical protein
LALKRNIGGTGGLAPGAASVRSAPPFSVPRWAKLATFAALILLQFALFCAGAAYVQGSAEAGLCNWDCEWYRGIIQHGYDIEPAPRWEDQASWAFFPLFPMLGRAVMLVTALDPFWSGTSVAVLCFVAFALLSFRYRALTRPEGNPVTWAVLLLVYPFGFYFLLPYTESLYLLLTLAVLWCTRRGAMDGAGLATGLLTATRPTGVVAIPYLAVQLLWRARALFRPGSAPRARLALLGEVLFPLALMPLGIVVYMIFLYWLTGDALAFSHVLVAWNRRLGDPLRNFYWGLAANDWDLVIHGVGASLSYNACFAIPAALGAVWLLWRRLPFEAWLLGCTVALALSGSAISLARYVAANPITLLLAGDVADRVRSRAARVVLTVLCLALQAFLMHRWYIRSDLLM